VIQIISRAHQDNNMTIYGVNQLQKEFFLMTTISDVPDMTWRVITVRTRHGSLPA